MERSSSARSAEGARQPLLDGAEAAHDEVEDGAGEEEGEDAELLVRVGHAPIVARRGRDVHIHTARKSARDADLAKPRTMEARIVNAAQAPWAVLLAPNLPLGPLSGWGLRDMLKLRCVCVSRVAA